MIKLTIELELPDIHALRMAVFALTALGREKDCHIAISGVAECSTEDVEKIMREANLMTTTVRKQ